MKGAILGPLVIFIAVACLSIMSTDASAEEDVITFCGQPLGQPVVVYAGEESIYLNIDFKNDWARWEIWLDVAIFDHPEWTSDVNMSAGDSWSTIKSPNATVPAGEYPATCWINRTYPDNSTDRVFHNFTVSYIHAVEFGNVRMRETFTGMRIEIDVVVNVRVDRFFLKMVVWDDYLTDPDDFEEVGLEPGTYSYSCRVSPEFGYDNELTTMGYYSFVQIGERTLIFDAGVEDPEVQAYEGVSLLTVMLTVVLLLALGLIAGIIIVRRRKRVRDPDEGD